MPNINLKGLNRGGSPAPAILTFMGMAGGAYYLYKQKGTDSNPNVIIEANPDSTVETKAITLGETAKKDLPAETTIETKAITLGETAKKDLPAETDTKLQEKSKMPGFSQDDQKDLTKPTTTKDSSEN